MNIARYGYLITGHIFYDNGPDETIRLVYDTMEGTIIEADVLRSLGWKALGVEQCADLQEWISQYTQQELFAMEDWDFEDDLLEWGE